MDEWKRPPISPISAESKPFPIDPNFALEDQARDGENGEWRKTGHREESGETGDNPERNSVSISHGRIHSASQKRTANSKVDSLPRLNVTFVNPRKLNDLEPRNSKD